MEDFPRYTVVGIVGLIASIITIFVFLSGKDSVNEIVKSNPIRIDEDISLEERKELQADSLSPNEQVTSPEKHEALSVSIENIKVPILGTRVSSKLVIDYGSTKDILLKTNFGESSIFTGADLSSDKKRVCYTWKSGSSGVFSTCGVGIINIDGTNSITYRAFPGQLLNNVVWSDNNRISFLIERSSMDKKDENKEIAGHKFSKFGSISAYVNENNIITDVKSF